LGSEYFNYLSTVYYQQAGRLKKHVCGCEGTVAGKGGHTLAFVGWVFLFSSLSLCSKNFIVILSLSFFLGLLVTIGDKFRCGPLDFGVGHRNGIYHPVVFSFFFLI
jgi:hypothetical protein